MTSAAVLPMAILTLLQAGAAPPLPDHLPPMVLSFLQRAGSCSRYSSLSDSQKQARRDLACNRLNHDRALLRSRYRRDPKVIKALNGPWVIVIQRVPVGSASQQTAPDQ